MIVLTPFLCLLVKKKGEKLFSVCSLTWLVSKVSFNISAVCLFLTKRPFFSFLNLITNRKLENRINEGSLSFGMMKVIQRDVNLVWMDFLRHMK